MTYLGFHEGEPNFLGPLVLTQREQAIFFLWPKLFFSFEEGMAQCSPQILYWPRHQLQNLRHFALLKMSELIVYDRTGVCLLFIDMCHYDSFHYLICDSGKQLIIHANLYMLIRRESKMLLQDGAIYSLFRLHCSASMLFFSIHVQQ